jgi:hypothetical protein
MARRKKGRPGSSMAGMDPPTHSNRKNRGHLVLGIVVNHITAQWVKRSSVAQEGSYYGDDWTMYREVGTERIER